jgi:hypothetical protein
MAADWEVLRGGAQQVFGGVAGRFSKFSLGFPAAFWDAYTFTTFMAVWEYKVISSGKGGFATPALLESYINQLGAEEWEIIEFRGQPDNPLAFSGLARRPTQRDWTLEDAAKAAAKVEADKLRQEFEEKFRSATQSSAGSAPESAETPGKVDLREDDGFRRLRDTERDADPDAPESEDEWDKLGEEDEVPTFFEAMRPHMRRNQRGPGMSAGVDFLAKKWDISEAEIIGALKECGLEIPEDEDAKVTYVEYDGDLYWVNVNRRGELWVNTKEKTRAAFRTVKANPVATEEEPKAEQAPREERRGRKHDDAPQAPAAPAEPLPAGPALLERIRPHMRRNRHEPGGSGSLSFLSRALKCPEPTLLEGFVALGLKPLENPGEAPVHVTIGSEIWYLNRDSRGGVWINARERKDEAQAAPAASADGAPSPAPEAAAPAPGNVLAATRLLLKETKTGAVAAPLERLASELGKSPDDILAALTGSGLKVPEKPREKPVFVEHAGEIFWINRNAKGELWLNAKASKYADGDDARPRKGKKRKDAGEEPAPAPEAPTA